MSLREQGEPIKIVNLGQRDGTTMMVRKDSTILRIEDLRGPKVAAPNRFSNLRLIIYKALRDRGMNIREVTLVEMPPPTCRPRSTLAPWTQSSRASRSWRSPRWTAMAASCS